MVLGLEKLLAEQKAPIQDRSKYFFFSGIGRQGKNSLIGAIGTVLDQKVSLVKTMIKKPPMFCDLFKPLTL